MFRKLVVALAVMLPLAAQVTETAAVARVDVVVTDATGGRVRGLSAADFEITENGERLAIVDFAEYSTDAAPAAPVTDTRFVPLQASASPTPPRRLVFLFGPGATRDDRDAAKALARPDDSVTLIEAAEGDFASLVAAAVVQLARHRERKAIVVFGERSEEMTAFANRRGVAVYDRNTLADAALDLGAYYAISFRAANPRAVEVKTTRPYTLRTFVSPPAGSDEDAVSDAVLAHHVVEPESNDLKISVSAEPTVVVGGQRQVKLHVLIPIRNLQLAREGAEVTGGFDVYVSTGDASGSISATNKQTHAIKWPAEALAKAGNRNIDFVVDVVVGAGRSRVSIGVVDRRSKKTGFQRIEVSG